MNARRYPRTSAEAFKGADYAGCIETPRNSVIGFHGHMRKPSLIPLDNSLVARFVRWLRLRGPI